MITFLLSLKRTQLVVLQPIDVAVEIVGKKWWHDDITFIIQIRILDNNNNYCCCWFFFEKRWIHDNIPFIVLKQHNWSDQ